jgi:hypothetical protein
MTFRKSIGPITPDVVTKLNMLGASVFGLRYILQFDQVAEKTFTAKAGPVGKALSKLVGAALLSQTAVIYELKNGIKVSDTDVAKVNVIISAAYLVYGIWVHAAGHAKTFGGLVTSALLFALNAFVGYA